ncbi:hypothetical protein LIER_41793 [Lithospermum erythrorhizon]|uniref:C2H2-type domain-containing protein n=1 Tax=Lithospermum erythrorhizon TaxID=34254 RepID=A0AAV3REL7_LITER
MDIYSMDEIFSMGSKDPHMSMIMKGKRTKRPRQPSPASAVFTSSSCSSGGDGSGGGGKGGEKMHSQIRSSDEQDRTQSGRRNSKSATIQIKNNIEKQEVGDDEMMNLEKISSRKLKEMTITTSSTIVGKASIYVYECKTCNRCFPSFQALGGHRTSHKKHKPMMEMEEINPKKLPSKDDHDQEEKAKKILKICPSSLLSLEMAKKNSHGSIINKNKAKVHECSICGAEFTSGQALGGHMRRHRNQASATTSTTESSHDDGGDRPRNVLELDLNFPAPPEEDHHDDSKFQLSLFSSPALVDC